MPRRLPQIALVTLAGYWAVLFVLTHLPGVGAPQPFAHTDKIVHFLAYAALAWLAAMALRLWRVPLPAVLLIVLLGAAVYAAVDEWLQTFVDGRTTDIFDWLADVAGVCLGLIVFLSTHNSLRRVYLRWQAKRS